MENLLWKQMIVVLNCLLPPPQRAPSSQLWRLRSKWYPQFHFFPRLRRSPAHSLPAAEVPFSRFLASSNTLSLAGWRDIFCNTHPEWRKNDILHHKAVIYALFPSTRWESNPPFGQFAHRFTDKRSWKDLAVLFLTCANPRLPALEMHYKTQSLCSLCLWLESAREK